ncbi:MAG: DNA cytosine methyltransferase [Chloroflexi bacterium]|nr:DNA cytosine methyltransferase [Chloroflexota bacterium]
MQLGLFDLSEFHPNAASWFEEMVGVLAVSRGPAWPDRFGEAIRQWLSSRNRHSIRTLSLFSGAGGLDIGFHDAGFAILEMVEIDPRFAATLKANASSSRILGDSGVRCIDIAEYHPPPDLVVDFIIGGPPCQTFSAAGRRAAGVPGLSDPRGELFRHYVRLLKELRPKGFLFENVYGITGAQNGEAWTVIQNAFREAGYRLFSRVLDAADYGVPQHRERLFIVGLREGEFLFPSPTHGPDSIGQEAYFTAGEAVADADLIGMTSGLNGKYGSLLNEIPPGLNYSFYTRELGHPSPIFSWRSKFSDFLYKADPDLPVRTIKAQGGQYTGPFSWENRPFTIGELKRLQTFPDRYELVGRRQAAIQQIGNSVPPQLARMLALGVLHQVFGVSLPFAMHFLTQDRELGFRRRKRQLTQVYARKAKQALGETGAGQTIGVLGRLKPMTTHQTVALTTDYALKVEGASGALAVELWYDLGEEAWEISAGIPARCDACTRYEVTIRPAMGLDWCLGDRLVCLRASALEPHLFTALWKALEAEIARQCGVADLVQLSGYYQYPPRVRAEMRLDEEAQSTWPWAVVSQVVRGVGVAAQLSVRELAMAWGMDEAAALPGLRALRSLGYEVRSHHTNPQIAESNYLIPYCFPTLSPRSVQRHKKLEMS